MKKYKILIIIAVLGFGAYMGYAITAKYMDRESSQKRISTIPNFKFERLTDSIFTAKDLVTDRPLILLYFNSSCEFCQIEAMEIKDNIAKFDTIQLVFVSTEAKTEIKNFAEEHGLTERVVFLQDPNMEFSKIFDVNTVPATYLYDRDQRLVKVFKGTVAIETMLAAFQNTSL